MAQFAPVIARMPSGPAGAGARSGCPSRGRPIDLVHLARQTLGDRALEHEILGLMARQITVFSGRLGLAGETERRQIAHALKGAARNVGAFALADAAEAFKNEPSSAATLGAFEAELERTASFIAVLRG